MEADWEGGADDHDLAKKVREMEIEEEAQAKKEKKAQTMIEQAEKIKAIHLLQRVPPKQQQPNSSSNVPSRVVVIAQPAVYYNVEVRTTDEAIDFAILNAMEDNPRDRMTILQIENGFLKFLHSTRYFHLISFFFWFPFLIFFLSKLKKKIQ